LTEFRSLPTRARSSGREFAQALADLGELALPAENFDAHPLQLFRRGRGFEFAPRTAFQFRQFGFQHAKETPYSSSKTAPGRYSG
jgi:hypothetical protein